MTANDPGRAPEDGGPPADREDPRDQWPTGSESSREVGRNILWGLASAYVGRVMFLQSLIWLVVGGELLAGAWTLVRGEMERRETLGVFSGRAQGTIEAPWWELEPSREQQRARQGGPPPYRDGGRGLRVLDARSTDGRLPSRHREVEP